MTPSALCRLFLLFGGISLLFNASAFSHMQGGLSFADAFGNNTLIAAFYGYFICGVLLILTCIAGGLHARRSLGGNWAERIPLVWISDADDGLQNRQAWEVRAYLIATLVVFALLPTYGVGHMGKTVMNDGWIHQKHAPATDKGVNAWDALPLIGAEWNSAMMTTQNARGEIELRLAPFQRPNGQAKLSEVDWFRWGTPLLLLLIALGVLYSLGWFLIGVVQGPGVSKQPAPESDLSE